MNRKPRCPCHGCTPETGRAPGCHGESCPHGWMEYQRQYREYHEAEVSHMRAESIADSIAIKFRGIRKKKKHI